MFACRGYACTRYTLLWRAARLNIHPLDPLKSAKCHSFCVTSSNLPILIRSASTSLLPVHARFLSQNVNISQCDDNLDDVTMDRETKQPRNTRLITLDRLEDEYMMRLKNAVESTDGAAAWRTGLDIFHEIQHEKGRGLGLEVSSFLIEVLGTRRRVDDCMRVLAYSRVHGVRPRIQAYSSAISCCYKEAQYGYALRVFEVMRNDGYVPQTVTYSHALSSALKSSQHELVLEIFDDMIKNRLDLNIIIYNNILNSCARAGDVHSALGVLQAIRQRQLEMTQSTYHSLAICAGKTGKWDLALDALDTMQANGFEPTSTIFNSVFSACAKSKQWEAVVEVYDLMPDDLRQNLQGVYLGAVIMAHAKADSEELKLRGLDIFYKHKEIQSEESQLNLFAYNAALIAMLETNQLEKMHPFAIEMKKLGMKWDTTTYQSLILSYIRAGAVETAVQMLQSNAKRMGKTTMCYREAIDFYDQKRKNPREAVRLTMQMMQFNKRLSRLDWHNALRLALQLPERAPYWNFRKWMAIRAKGIIEDVPPHLMLPSHADQRRSLLQGDTESEESAEVPYQLGDYHSRKRRLNCRQTVSGDEQRFL
ncbi:putative tetratricopeptide-like helical domain superfamily, pentacotripeptide-repeat region of PRORP [Plasmopara halstedii]